MVVALFYLLWYFDELCNNQAVASFEVKSRTFPLSKKTKTIKIVIFLEKTQKHYSSP
jgi:hypothetical protein